MTARKRTLRFLPRVTCFSLDVPEGTLDAAARASWYTDPVGVDGTFEVPNASNVRCTPRPLRFTTKQLGDDRIRRSSEPGLQTLVELQRLRGREAGGGHVEDQIKTLAYAYVLRRLERIRGDLGLVDPELMSIPLSIVMLRGNDKQPIGRLIGRVITFRRNLRKGQTDTIDGQCDWIGKCH